MSNNLLLNNAETVLRLMSKTHNGFQICHLNCRSLSKSKLDYLNTLFPPTELNIICITESWFRSSFTDNLCELKNYFLLRHDRQKDSRGGGIAVYCRIGLKATIVMKSTLVSSVEYLGIEIQGEYNAKCLIVCMYFPHYTNYLNGFFEELGYKSSNYENVIVCGDFNVSIIKDHLSAQQFIDNVTTCGLSIVNQRWPTRYGVNSTPALLDVMMCSKKSHSIYFDQLCLGGISDHDLLFYVYKFDLKTVPMEPVYFRDFNSINIMHC